MLSETQLADAVQQGGKASWSWKGKLADRLEVYDMGFAIRNSPIKHLHELQVLQFHLTPKATYNTSTNID